MKMLEKISQNLQEKNKSNANEPRKIEELSLPACRLKFDPQQLQNLNYVFHKKMNEKKIETAEANKLIQARSITERLIQRLVCGVGKVDSKFTSKYLVHLHDPKEINTKMEYLIRIDNLSNPRLYPRETSPELYVIENFPDFPKGYGRIRIFSSLYNTWGEFADVHGYLRRDMVQSRYVELLSLVAGYETPKSPMHIDESVLCASPGKVVDASTLRSIFRTPPEEQIYFGTNGAFPSFPDPRDFRIAIVDEPNGICMKVDFLIPNLYSTCIDVRLLIGIESDAWPCSTDMPTRILLGHSDSFVYLNAAQTGFYLVGYGIQSSAWQIRLPIAEDTILKNYSPTSTVINILNICLEILEEIFKESALHQRFEYTYRILNHYIIRTALLHALEKDGAKPNEVLFNWSPPTLSTHVLKILDSLVDAMCKQTYPNYFFPDANLLINPGHLSKDDFIYEATRLGLHIKKFHEISITSTDGVVEFEKMVMEHDLQVMLINRWIKLVDSLLPMSSKENRNCFSVKTGSWEVAHTQYTSRQLEYISFLLESALNVKKITLKPTIESCGELVPDKTLQEETSLTDNIISIVLALVEQSRVYYLSRNPSYKRRQKLAEEYDTLIFQIVDLIRKANENLNDCLDFTKIIIKWLYRTIELNRRLLLPILKPYLRMIFIASHECSWFLENMRMRLRNADFGTLAGFSILVNENKLTPGELFNNCLNKNCKWAENMLKIIETEPTRVIFIKGRGKLSRHTMSIAGNDDDDDTNNVNVEQMNYFSIPENTFFYNLFNTVNKIEYDLPRHDILRDNSPLTKIFDYVHRHGEHRCAGDIVETLMAMQKYAIFKDICSILPNDDRDQIMELLHKTSQERKLSLKNKLPPIRTSIVISEYCLENNQMYAPNGVRIKEENMNNRKAELDKFASAGLLSPDRSSDDSIIMYDGNGKVRAFVKSKESFRSPTTTTVELE